jgi:hypothetical protein
MICLFENTGELVHRGSTGRLERRVGQQVAQGRPLLQQAYELQSDGVVRFEAGSELVRPAGSASGSGCPGPVSRF